MFFNKVTLPEIPEVEPLKPEQYTSTTNVKNNDSLYMVGVTNDRKYAQLRVGGNTYITLTLSEGHVRDLIRMLETTLTTIGTEHEIEYM
jgi:hypothetical protein